ncbi:MAG: DUF3108 domain-containing protein [Myxococcota bacterium]
MWLVPAALAGPLVDGERLAWRVSWMGVDAGEAWATLHARGEAWAVEAGCRSARWLAPLYPIDDLLWSEPGRYRTRFREGGFQQDQDMRFGPDALVVARSQLIDGAWKQWEDRYPAAPGAEDPVSAFYRLREDAVAGGEARFPLFTGRRVVEVVAAAVDEGDRLAVHVRRGEDGPDVKDAMTVWLSDDADRVPVEAVIQTRAGPVRVTLEARSVE